MMALPRFLKTLEEVDEALRSEYKEQSDGSFALDIKGADPKLNEFRDNNRTLHTEIESLKLAMKPFEGVDMKSIALAQKMAEQAKTEEEKKLLQSGNFDEVIKRRTAVAVDEANKRVKEIQTTLGTKDEAITKLTSRLGDLTIDREVQTALDAAGVKVRGGALSDVLARARQTWGIDAEGSMVPTDKKGSTKYGADGDDLTMKEYVTKDLIEKATHLFEGSGGGGSGGGKPGKGLPGQKTLDANDPMVFGRNVADIASGKVVVRTPADSSS